MRLGHAFLEAGGEIGEDDLAHLAGPDAARVDEAIGDAASGPLGPSFDPADEHKANLPRDGIYVNKSSHYVVTTRGPERPMRKEWTEYCGLSPKTGPEWTEKACSEDLRGSYWTKPQIVSSPTSATRAKPRKMGADATPSADSPTPIS